MFTTKVFNTDIFDKYLSHLKDVECNFLEIGTFEGQSTVYLLENWKHCHVTTIDPIAPYPIPGYEDYIKPELLNTIQTNLAPYADRCTYINDFSYNALPTQLNNSYDMAFIDGDHRALSVLEDAACCYELVKPDGLIIFDDRKWVPKGYKPGEYDMNCPNWGITSFLLNYPMVQILEDNYVTVIKAVKL